MFRHISFALATEASHLRVLCASVKPSYTQRPFHCAVSKALFSSAGKDLPTPQQPTPVDKLYSHDTDILLEQLHKARSIDRILDLVSMHIDVMNDKHISTTFFQIHDHLRGPTDLVQADKLTENPAFQSLCNRAMTRARFLTPQEVINVLKTLTKLNVHCNTYVMQAMLKMLCSQLNDLSLKELIFVNFLLQKHGKNNVVDSLKLALPLVLQVQIEQQLDSEDLNEVVSCLRMACKAKLKPSVIEKVIAALQTRISDFTPQHAVTMIYSLFSLHVPADGYMHLVQSAFEIVSNNVKELPHQVIIDFVKTCCRKSFYYRSFFINVSKLAVSEGWELHECYDLMHSFYKLDFFSPDVLNLLTERILLNTETVKHHSKYSVLSLSELYTHAEYQIPKVHSVLDVLSSSEDKIDTLCKLHPHLFVKMVTCWTMLGYFSDRHLSKALIESFLASAWTISKKAGRVAEFENYICCLHWALEVYEKNTAFRIPANFLKNVIHAVQQSYLKSADYPLTSFLESGLGGQQFFQNGFFTHNGHFIDHLLAVRNGNYPVSLSHMNKDPGVTPKIKFVEDVPLPDDAKIVPVVIARKNHYCADPEILKASVALKIRNLTKMSFCPVVVNYEKWYHLPDREKIPFLMRQIKEAVETDNVSRSNLCPL